MWYLCLIDSFRKKPFNCPFVHVERYSVILKRSDTLLKVQGYYFMIHKNSFSSEQIGFV